MQFCTFCNTLCKLSNILSLLTLHPGYTPALNLYARFETKVSDFLSKSFQINTHLFKTYYNSLKKNIILFYSLLVIRSRFIKDLRSKQVEREKNPNSVSILVWLFLFYKNNYEYKSLIFCNCSL
jgi:hypothetical protein